MSSTTSRAAKIGAFFSFLAGSVGVGVLAAGVAMPGLAVANAVTTDMVSLAASVEASLPIIDLQSKSTIYAKQGDQEVAIASFYDKNRVPVTSDEISQYAKDAVVAIENPTFWTDSGVNVASAARALVQNLASGDTVSGASTITMQLVKNQLQEQAQNAGDDEAEAEATEQTMTRKLRDMWLALGVTKQYTKDQILTQYLNISFMGGQIYGIEAASEYYFNTTAKDLTLPQAATLAAMLPSPSTYSPDKEENLDRVLERRNLVLDKMLSEGYITQEEHDDAVASAIETTITPTRAGCALADYNAYFCEYVVASIQNDSTFGDTEEERTATLQRGGLNIYTTLDLDLQSAAHDASVYWVPQGSVFATASTSVEVGSGKILVMVQNRDYDVNADTTSLSSTAVNYNTDYAYGGSSGFQPGSSAKVFTLLDWLNKGNSLNTTVNSSYSMTFDQSKFTNSCSTGNKGAPSWTLTNSYNWGKSKMSVLEATVKSVNTAFASMALQLDLCDIQNVAQSLGVHNADGSDVDYTSPSNIIGSGSMSVSPLTMASAFATIANNGIYCTTTPFERIVDSRTNEEVETPGTTCTQAVSSDVAAAATYALEQALDPTTGVTASGANPQDGTAVAGKTGTNNDAVQNWLVGYSTAVSTATWVGDPLTKVGGYDSSTYSHGKQGVNLKSYIWHDVMTAIDKEYPGSAFPTAPTDLVSGSSQSVPNVTGLSLTAAETALTNAGFSYSVGSTVASSIQSGYVASTEPSGGSQASKGSQVVIHASDGSLNSLPDVTGQTQANAIATLAAAGFSNVQVTESATTDQSQNGTVISMSPSGGSDASSSTTITLTVGKYEAAASSSSSSSSP